MRTPRHTKPLGQPTRGKTTFNRLRQIDVYIALAWPHILTAGAPLVVDVGYGAYPWTALDMHARWQAINPHVRLLGVEIDPTRVATALPYAQPPAIDFRVGGFNLAGEPTRIIRAYNVLRQYEEDAVAEALAQMSGVLEPGGLLIEGTSTPSGGRVAFDVYQKVGDGLVHRELVFGSNFRPRSSSIDPVEFQAILPKRLIHHMTDERPAAFFDSWRRALAKTRSLGYPANGAQTWSLAAALLRTHHGWSVDVRPRICRRGYLVLRDTLS